MVADMSYHTVANVIESWELIRRMPNYEQRIGTALFQKLFAMEPESKVIFGFQKDMDPKSDLVVSSPRFVKHAQYFIQMIDKALSLLGPDIDILTEILLELGANHVRYGVKLEYYPSMGRALIDSVEEALGDQFTTPIKNDWVEVYGALSYDMIRAQKLSK
uniref:Globin domain-containing protein n=1 Tax=Craspedostauros australis TaxID=1486917 RepID=A0A7R9ZQC7_9STRA|mmetsp:Transcript_5636/g.15269  ORF Transcript_5636/g.15269 Transcript_5636/m.15269 type:complete len:161 (+) Transcript_5636:744-1226(+)